MKPRIGLREREEGEIHPPWLQRGEERRRFVRQMFARIAPRYDLLNSLLSLRLHYLWRRWSVQKAGLRWGDWALDVCAGTGDFALELARMVGPEGRVFALDFCEPMLHLTLEKAHARGLQNIQPVLGDALALPFPEDRFGAVTIGFGLRNIIDPVAAFREMARVTRPGGRVLCLELNRPQSRWFRPLYDLYTLRLLPFIGGLLSQRDAYEYLPNSILNFTDRETLAQQMQEAGLQEVEYDDFTLGVVCLHLGTKRNI